MLRKKLAGLLVAALCLLPSLGQAYTINGNLDVRGNVIGGVKTVGQMVNLNIKNATTTNANDSIKIECGGAACSTSNPGWVTVNSAATPGNSVTFKVTSNVTILLTGATFEFGGQGDIAGGILRVNAVDNNGSLVWCVSYLGQNGFINNTLDTTTQANANLNEELLCNADVTSATNTITELAWFRFNFDDTGGAAEDLYAVQTGVGDINNNETADGQFQPWNTTFGGFSANPTGGTARWMQLGDMACLTYIRSGTGTSNSTSFTMTAPVDAKFSEVYPVTDVVDNGTGQTTPGRVDTTTASRTLNVFKTSNGGAFTGSGGKAAGFDNICYIVTNAAP